jgi:hypothetical protein
MESCSNQKKVLKEKYILDFRFFKVATLCLDDNFAHSWHSLNQLHLEGFSNSREGVPTYAEVIVEARSSMQHSITLLLSQIALTQPGGVLGHCPVEKHTIVPLSINQMGWRIAAECCGSHAGLISVPLILNKSQDSVTSKAPSYLLHASW